MSDEKADALLDAVETHEDSRKLGYAQGFAAAVAIVRAAHEAADRIESETALDLLLQDLEKRAPRLTPP